MLAHPKPPLSDLFLNQLEGGNIRSGTVCAHCKQTNKKVYVVGRGGGGGGLSVLGVPQETGDIPAGSLLS